MANVPGKKENVKQMFNDIAHKYDFLNHFLSLNIDKVWRRKLIRIIGKSNPTQILDVATGTCDLAIAAAKLRPEKITGSDISEGMLAIGREKICKKKLENLIELVSGDAENLPFKDNSFDAVMAAFGVRNFGDLEKGLQEMQRVLHPGGGVYILEFSKPGRWPVKQIYHFYFRHVLPLIGRMVSKDSRAYTYLPDSVAAFPEGDDFLKILTSCGFSDVIQKRLTMGVATIYSGKKVML